MRHHSTFQCLNFSNMEHFNSIWYDSATWNQALVLVEKLGVPCVQGLHCCLQQIYFFRTCDISHEIPRQVTLPCGQRAAYAVVSKPVPMSMSMPSPGSLHRLTAWPDLSSVLSLCPVTTGLCLSLVSITGLGPHLFHSHELPDSLGSGLPFGTAAACWGWAWPPTDLLSRGITRSVRQVFLWTVSQRKPRCFLWQQQRTAMEIFGQKHIHSICQHTAFVHSREMKIQKLVCWIDPLSRYPRCLENYQGAASKVVCLKLLTWELRGTKCAWQSHCSKCKQGSSALQHWQPLV